MARCNLCSRNCIVSKVIKSPKRHLPPSPRIGPICIPAIQCPLWDLGPASLQPHYLSHTNYHFPWESYFSSFPTVVHVLPSGHFMHSFILHIVTEASLCASPAFFLPVGPFRIQVGQNLIGEGFPGAWGGLRTLGPSAGLLNS